MEDLLKELFTKVEIGCKNNSYGIMQFPDVSNIGAITIHKPGRKKEISCRIQQEN
jgi:hypothetical protein